MINIIRISELNREDRIKEDLAYTILAFKTNLIDFYVEDSKPEVKFKTDLGQIWKR